MNTQPTVTISLGELADASESLEVLASYKVSGALSYAISLIVRATKPHLNQFEVERAKLLDLYTFRPATQTARTRNWKDSSSQESFSKAFCALRETPVDLHGIRKIKRSLLDAELVVLDGEDSALLGWLIVEDVLPAFAEEDE